jgi:hypothetical protein
MLRVILLLEFLVLVPVVVALWGTSNRSGVDNTVMSDTRRSSRSVGARTLSDGSVSSASVHPRQQGTVPSTTTHDPVTLR